MAVDDEAGGLDALVELGGGAGVLAQATVEAVFEQGGQLREFVFDGEAGGFGFADLLARVVFAGAEGGEGVAQLGEALGADAVVEQGLGVLGGEVEQVLGGVGEGVGAQVKESAVAIVGRGLEAGGLLGGGVGVQVAGYFAGAGGQLLAAVGFDGGFAFAGALGLLAQRAEVVGELLELGEGVLEGFILLVGGGVLPESEQGVLGGGVRWPIGAGL